MGLHASKLVRKMKNARISRIVSHKFPSLEIHSFDALMGRTTILEYAKPCDADGKDMQEEVWATSQDAFDSDPSSQKIVL